MKSFVVRFAVVGSMVIDADNKADAAEYFKSESGQEAVGMILSRKDPDIIQIEEMEEESERLQ